MLVLTTSTLAADDFIKANKVAGFWGRGTDRVWAYLKFSKEAKLNYYIKLTDKRFSELLLVAEEKDLSNFEQVSSRYSTYAGFTQEYLVANQLIGKRDELIKKFERQRERIGQLVDTYEYDSAYWLLLMNNKNTLDVLINKLEEAK